MTLEECYQEYERTGQLDGFEGWTECVDNYPEYNDLFYGGSLGNTQVEAEATVRQKYYAELRLNYVFYIMIGFIAIILIVLLGVRKK